MVDYYLTIKALHIIFIVTWFAGLFYMPRLFIYHCEAKEKSEVERNILQGQFKIMQRRLWYGITWPSMVLVLIFGILLLMEWNILDNPWLQIKLGFVLGLYVYHFYLHKVFKDINSKNIHYSPLKLRYINEVSTIFLIAIVFLVVLKNSMSFLYALTGLVLVIFILVLGIKIYKKLREN